MRSTLFLALDIGTSSVRAGLYDSEANVLPETTVKHERDFTSNIDNGFEIDADKAFLQIVSVVDDLLKKCPENVKEIQYSAASCFWHSLLGVDREGIPTTKVFTWAETRTAKYVKVLQDDLDENETHNRTGCHFHSSYWTVKLLWLKHEHSKVFNQTDRWLSFSDYVALKLFGEAKTSVSMASGTGIFDFRKNDWDAPLLEYLNLGKENLPEIVANDQETFRLRDEYANRWDKLGGTKFFPAIGDGAGNNLGTNCVTKDKAVVMIGTSGAMRVAYDGRVPKNIPQGIWCYRIDRNRVIIGGALSDGGGLYHWLKDNFRLEKNDRKTETEIKKRSPNQSGITFLPFLAGERSTGYNEFAEGAIIGLRQAHDKIDIVQAALESVAYRFAEIYDLLNEIVVIKQIVGSGGALRDSKVWTQIICDVLSRDIDFPEIQEASLRGVVLLALESSGLIDDIAALEPVPGSTFTFDSKRQGIYKKARKRHKKYYDLLINK